MEACRGCKFFAPFKDSEDGHCRRYPPSRNKEWKSNAERSLFPIVSVDNWCGEWQPAGGTPIFPYPTKVAEPIAKEGEAKC